MPRGFGADKDPPSGMIALWDGQLSNIPSGWALCDGNNGTPNLLDKFLRGIGPNDTSGGTGGSHTVTLSESQLPNHTHSASVDAIGNHDHTVPVAKNGQPEPFDDQYTTGLQPDNDHTRRTTTDGAHAHNAGLPSAGAGDSIDIRPNYYELAFIMKT